MECELPIQRFTASGLFCRATREKGMEGGTWVERGVYSEFRLLFSGGC